MEGQAIGDFYAWHGLPFSQLASGQRATELNSSSSRVVCPQRGLAEECAPGLPTERTREDICSPR